MQRLSSGSYLICNPAKFLLPHDFRKFTRNIIEYESKLKDSVEWGIFMNDDSNLSYAWFNVKPGKHIDQMGNEYITDKFLACVPIEMLTHVDNAQIEPFHFIDNFVVDYRNDIIFINHIQIRKQNA